MRPGDGMRVESRRPRFLRSSGFPEIRDDRTDDGGETASPDDGEAATTGTDGGKTVPPRMEGETERQYEVFLWRVENPGLTHTALAKISGVSETSVGAFIAPCGREG